MVCSNKVVTYSMTTLHDGPPTISLCRLHDKPANREGYNQVHFGLHYVKGGCRFDPRTGDDLYEDWMDRWEASR